MRGSEGRSKATWHIITSASALHKSQLHSRPLIRPVFFTCAGCTGEGRYNSSVREKGVGVICSGLSHLLLHKIRFSVWRANSPLNFQIVSSGPRRKPEPVCCESTTAAFLFKAQSYVAWTGCYQKGYRVKVNSIQLNILSTGLKTNQNYLFKLLWGISPITKNSYKVIWTKFPYYQAAPSTYHIQHHHQAPLHTHILTYTYSFE